MNNYSLRALPCLITAYLGVIALSLGIAGVVLPLLPTTPFVLLATFCFANSSPRFYRWLHQHPYFAQINKQWQENRAIPAKAKYLALAMMAVSLVLIYYHLGKGQSMWFAAFATLLCLIGIIYMWRLPTIPR
ncbi:MAG: hypothetical protein CR975_03320 [Gammaproteobacteria bacterium]|nr:MAG: hypothetical protein CR975_03320 [Gammaproteobacteria bacterium]